MNEEYKNFKITITLKKERPFQLFLFWKTYYMGSQNNNRKIKLSVITLSGFNTILPSMYNYDLFDLTIDVCCILRHLWLNHCTNLSLLQIAHTTHVAYQVYLIFQLCKRWTNIISWPKNNMVIFSYNKIYNYKWENAWNKMKNLFRLSLGLKT